MNRSLRLSLLAIVVAFALVITSTPTRACGPFALEAIFVFTVHPEYPLANFARGDLGVVQKSYARSYLYVAYRHLNGLGFNEKEQQALTELWKDRLDYTWELGDQEWLKEWTTARAKVPGVAAPPQLDVYRHREKPNEYETYLNCQKDAFSSAVSTLEARIKKFGADNIAIKEWVEAQDEVFANCSEGEHIPKPASASDPLIRADRDYQIAAANFYAGNFDSARDMFSKMAGNADSPWSQKALYLVARTLVRKASLGPLESKQSALSEAEAQLKKILGDQKSAPIHVAAERLMSVVMLRLHPETRLNELARLLMVKDRNEQAKQDLWDYTVLLDQFLGDGETETKTTVPPAILVEDLTDWINTFASASGPEPLEHSISKWQATRSIPWLVAAISRIDSGHAQAAEITAQAAKIGPDSPAYPTILFHLVRVDLTAGKMAEARRRIDDSLASHGRRLNASSLNLLLNMRMALAANLEDFLTYAQRLPAGFSWNDDGREIPADLKEGEESNRALEGKKLFDSDAAKILNEGMPLSVLKRAAASTTMPEHLRRDLVQATWLRAVLLGDYQTANEVTPALEALLPNAATLLQSFSSASQPDAKRFAAIYAWLKFPGLEPVVDAGIGRQTPLAEQDSYRDNWWCSSAFQPSTTAGSESDKDAGSAFKIDTKNFPVFLTPAQRAAAAKEHSTLESLGAAPNYICRQVVQWANLHPDDPRAPEALHLAVKTTRYGCTNKDTGRWSKAAYDLLHKRYPGSQWAKQTPYWFKD